jgi:hypothetical protein
MHITEFAMLIEKMQNEHIIITHTTQRTSMREVRETLKGALSPEKYDRLILLMDKKQR